MQFMQPILCWGLLGTMTRLMVDTDKATRASMIGAALNMATTFNIVLLALIAVAARSSYASGPAHLLPYAAAVAALAVYPQILLGFYVANGDALRYRGLSLIGFALQAASLGAVAAVFAMDSRTAMLTMIGAAALYAALSVVRLARAAQWRAGSAEYKALLGFGVPVVLYTLAGQSSDFVTRYVLASSVAARDFGAFSAGQLYASVIPMLSSAVNLAWVPLYYRRVDEWTASGVYRRFAELLAGSMAMCSAFLILFSQELLAAYSGGSVTLGVSTLGALVIAAWLNSAVWMGLCNPLFQQKRTKLILSIALIAAAVSVPLGLLLIARHGALGAALALVINALLSCGAAAAALRKLGIPGLDYRKLAIVLCLLVLLSSPAMDLLHQSSDGMHRLAAKSLLLVAFAGLAFVLLLRPGLHALRIIESSTAK